MTPLARTLTIICAVGTATAAGVFFSFSTFAINGLKRLPPSDGMAAMQAINKEAPTPPFMILLFGTGTTLVALIIYAALHPDDSASKYQLVAGAVYIVGVLLLTGRYHVPRNDILDGLDPNSSDGIVYWATYLKEWVRMNHLRTLAPLVSAALLTVSLQVG